MGMTYGKAISTLESETQETIEAPVMLEAIDKILSMATINAVNKNALMNAVRFLRNHVKEQEPRVLTLEETLKANPVWFETYGSISPAIIDHEESTAGFCVIVFGIEDNWNDYRIDRYNKTWRCWTARPTKEQSKAVKWE